MNYLNEITAFNRLAEIERISPKEQALWRAMMSIANSLGWPEAFTVANLTLQSRAVLSEREVTEARNRLAQRGLIVYKSRSGNRAPSYSMISISATNPADNPAGNHVDSSVDNHVDSSGTSTADNPATLNKQNKTKQNKTKSVNNARARFEPPSVDEVAAYCRERGNQVDPGRFVDYYASKGWVVGKSPMKDWKAAVRTWEKNDGQAGIKHGEAGGEDKPASRFAHLGNPI